jgi:type I restriction-modification system DNA methylase subunit
LVDPDTRHDLGEFYTPDWLAEIMLDHVLAENPDVRLLDPACGSGTFLYTAIRLKRRWLKERDDLRYWGGATELADTLDVSPYESRFLEGASMVPRALVRTAAGRAIGF